MKNLFSTLFCVMLLTRIVTAQEIESLKAPTMPSATIIGTQINDINRPKTLNALEVSLLNNFLDSSHKFVIPNDFAIEFNPYMLGNRTNFSYLEYIENSISKNFWRNLSLSVSSTNSFRINDTLKCKAIGFGGRTILYNGEVDKSLKDDYTNIIKTYYGYLSLTSMVNTKIKGYLSKNKDKVDFEKLETYLLAEKNYEDTILTKKIIKSFFQDNSKSMPSDSICSIFNNYFEKEMLMAAQEKFAELLNKIKTERYGLRVELSGAYGLTFPTNDVNYSISPKYGIWANVSYKPYKKKYSMDIPSNFDFTGLIRWIGNNREFIDKFNPIDTVQFHTGNVFDLGIRANYEKDKIAIGVEYIYRLNQNKEYVTVNGNEYSRNINNNTYKLVFNVNYNMGDNLVLSYNIGKNFDFINGKGGNFMTGFTVNYGIDGLKKKDLLMKSIK